MNLRDANFRSLKRSLQSLTGRYFIKITEQESECYCSSFIVCSFDTNDKYSLFV